MTRITALVTSTLLIVAIFVIWFFHRSDVPHGPYRRFVEPAHNLSPSTSAFPAVALADETRFVLSAPEREWVIIGKERVPQNGRVEFSFRVPKRFPDAEQVGAVVHYRRGRTFTRLPTMVVDITRTVTGREGRVHVQLPEEAIEELLEFDVRAFALDLPLERAHRTDEIAIPKSAYIDFAIGVRQAEYAESPIEFRIEACRDHACDLLFEEVVDPARDVASGWQDRRIPLDLLAGSTRSFSFRTRKLSPGDPGISYPLWANPTVYAPRTTPGNQPNVIVLSIDTLAAQHLQSYGYPFETAPFVHQTFAEGGTVFEHCVAAATTTPQSHMSMFMGVQPCVHGILTGMEEARQSLVTLAEVLRLYGYETGAVTEDGWLGHQHGFGRGFNVYSENKSADIMAPDGQVDVTFSRATRWLERNHDKRFFLFLHTFQVHDPYSPPVAYQDLFTQRDGVDITADSPRHQREMVAYDQEIRYTDDELRKLFDVLRQYDLAENTIFILTSDHGEEFFQHGHWGHGPTFYEAVSRVPLMIWGPGHVPAGQRVETLTGHIDLMPTILELAGVPIPAQVSGQSLAGWLREGHPTPTPSDRVMFSESRVLTAIGPGYELLSVTPPAFLVQEGSRKLSRFVDGEGYRYTYYDLSSDPGEAQDLFEADPASAIDLRALVDTYEEVCANSLDAIESGALPGDRPQVELDPAAEEKLRALGYFR